MPFKLTQDLHLHSQVWHIFKQPLLCWPSPIMAMALVREQLECQPQECYSRMMKRAGISKAGA